MERENWNHVGGYAFYLCRNGWLDVMNDDGDVWHFEDANVRRALRDALSESLGEAHGWQPVTDTQPPLGWSGLVLLPEGRWQVLDRSAWDSGYEGWSEGDVEWVGEPPTHYLPIPPPPQEGR